MKRIILAVILLLAVPVFGQSGPTFFYVVTAVDTNGFETGFSNQATAAFNQGQKTATLTWVASAVPTGAAAVAGYNAYRSQTSGGPYKKINTALITAGVTYSDGFVLLSVPSGLAAVVN